jgi:hypothetical protein
MVARTFVTAWLPFEAVVSVRARRCDLDAEQLLAELDNDATVAAKVAHWERDHGIKPRDWWAIGRDEGKDPPP